MKKKLMMALLGAAMALCLVACGGEDAEPAVEETAVVEEAEAEPAAETTDFTIGDVSADMIETGIYAVDDEGTENIIAIFTNEGVTYVCVMMIPQEDQGSVACGPVTDVAVETDEEGTEWSCWIFDDVYSGSSCTAVFADFDDGSVMISNEDLSYVIAGEYLSSQDEVIDYMGAAVSFIE